MFLGQGRMKGYQDDLFFRLMPFADLTASDFLYRDRKISPFADPFLLELTATRPVQRLKKIGFLGAIDYRRHGSGREPHRRRHNRYDHSVGVALLALHYAAIRGLPQQTTRTLSAAGLLHDVGHGPLSHTLEPVFKRQFDICHHQLGLEVIYGNSILGDEIVRIMNAYSID